MKKRIWLILAVLVGLVGIAAAGCSAKASTNGSPSLGGNFVIPPNILQQSGIWISGEGKVKAVPDVVILSLGIEAQAKTMTDAQTQARTSMDAVMKVLKAKGIKDNDIQTQRFSINPVIRWIDKENRQEILGYRVDNMVTVKIRKIDDAGPVIDAVADAGGDQTRINGISFTIDDPSALQAQAQQLALKDAMAKAKATADTMGVKLGKLTYTQLSGYTSVPPTPMMYAKEAGARDAAVPPTAVSPGELTIQASATAVWAIE
ncbi:MAG: SIMPL domain-containing protein [Chloroflexi bacterium]|nr:SIMPL domain-containing protein [Chloroflexota bacterium]